MFVVLRKHCNCNYITFKLIQVRAEDSQRWQQIQNPMLFAIWHTLEPVVISMPSVRQHVARRALSFFICALNIINIKIQDVYQVGNSVLIHPAGEVRF